MERLRPATGEAFTASFPRRALEYWSTFLEQVDSWVGPDTERIYAVLDNLSMHWATDVLLFCLTHPRWEFVFQPTYAAYLNLIEPWWKTLRSLALKGRRFETQAGRLLRRWNRPPPTGMRTGIPLSGDDAGAISRAALLALLWSPLSAFLSGCTTEVRRL